MHCYCQTTMAIHFSAL